MVFTNLTKHVNTEDALKGKLVVLAVYAEDIDSAVNIIVNEALAKTMVFTQLEDFLSHIRAAILDSMIRHGNPTAPRRQ